MAIGRIGVGLFFLISAHSVFGESLYNEEPFQKGIEVIKKANKLQDDAILHEFGVGHRCEYANPSQIIDDIRDRNFLTCKKMQEYLAEKEEKNSKVGFTTPELR